MRSFADPAKQYPWAKSVIICAYWYGKYKIPSELKTHYAKYYLVDSRTNRDSEGYQLTDAFLSYLEGTGLRVATKRKFGITALRWAAMKAGIGLIRRNNFFYTEKGSWQYLEAFLVDESLEYREKCTLKPCPDKCNLCVKACPTKSLIKPYMMSRNTCVSCLTTWDGWDMPHEPRREKIGGWVYGCDVCQEVCPYNRNKWSEEEEFPGLSDMAAHLTLSELVQSDYEYLREVLQSQLFYIPEDKLWRYKVNALNVMLNEYQEAYLPAIKAALSDTYREVREMAQFVLSELGLKYGVE